MSVEAILAVLADFWHERGDLVAGWAMGLLTALLTTYCAHFFLVRRERNARKEERNAALKTLILELETEKEKLTPTGRSIMDTSTYEMVKNRGLLATVEPQVARDLIYVYQRFLLMNQVVDIVKSRNAALLSSSRPHSPHETEEDNQLLRAFDQIKADSRTKIDECIHHLTIAVGETARGRKKN